MILLLGILLLGVFLRFWNLRTNPNIFGDEGMNMSAAWNVAHGSIRMFALKYAFVPHPPLYYLIAGGLLRLFGNDILVARSLSAFYGIFTILALYFVGRRVHSRGMGLLSSLFFAIWPLIIADNRLAVTYNQLLFFSLMTFLFSLIYIETDKRKWIYFSGVTAGLSMLTSFFGVCDFIYLVVVSFVFHKKKTWLAPFITLCFFGLFILFMLWVAAEPFLFDLKHDFARSELSSIHGIIRMFREFIDFVEVGYWVPLSLVGLFMIEKTRERNLLLLIFILYSALLFKTIGAVPHTFQAVSLMPYLMMGLAIFSMKAVVHIWNMVFLGSLRSIQWLRESSIDSLRKLGEDLGQRSHETWKGIASAILFLIFASFVATVSLGAFLGALSGFRAPWDKLTVALSSECDRAIAFINQNIKETDFVITSPHIGWQINGNVSDILPPLVVKGIKTPFYGVYPQDRFAYDCSYDKAKFVIIDDFWRKWSARIPVVKAMMDEIETWPIVLRSGEFVIYQNPHSPAESSH